jgi:hypothetical protein
VYWAIRSWKWLISILLNFYQLLIKYLMVLQKH